MSSWFLESTNPVPCKRMHDIDIKDVSISSYRKVLSEKRRRTRARDALAKALRTVAWHTEIQHQVGCIAARRMGTQIEGSPDHTHKWLNYKLGTVSPRKYMVQRVENQLPGTRKVFEHVMWDVCDLEQPIESNHLEWKRRLDPEVQLILERHGIVLADEKLLHRRSDDIGLRMLEERASYDALACLILQLRMAHATGNKPASAKLGLASCRMLLILSPLLAHHNILRPFGELVEQELLPLSRGLDGLLYCFWHNGYEGAVNALRLRVASVAGHLAESGSAKSWAKHCISLLDGQYGPLLKTLVVKTKLPICEHRPIWLARWAEIA